MLVYFKFSDFCSYMINSKLIEFKLVENSVKFKIRIT